MNRRGFLSALALGTVGLSKADLPLGQSSQAQQTTHATTRGGTTTFGEDFTVTTRRVESVSADLITQFEENYQIALDAQTLYPSEDLGDTAYFIGQSFGTLPRVASDRRLVAEVTRTGDRSNEMIVADLAAVVAGAVGQEMPIPRAVDLYFLMEYEDKPLDGDREPQVYLNQRYRVKGEWAKAYVTDDLTAREVLSRVLGTAHTNRTTTSTTTTSTTTEAADYETEEPWTFDYDVQESDGTLNLISGGLSSGDTLYAEYDRAGTYLYGVVQNVSGSTLSYAEVQANLSVNGAVVAQALANMQNLSAGQRWRFEALASESVEFDYAELYLSGTTY